MSQKASKTRRTEYRHTLFASVAVFEGDSDSLIGYLNDLSPTGMGFTVAAPIALNERLTLRLELPEEMSFGTTMKIEGRGVWSVPAELDNMHHYGFRFEGNNALLHSQLIEVIRYFAE